MHYHARFGGHLICSAQGLMLRGDIEMSGLLNGDSPWPDHFGHNDGLRDDGGPVLSAAPAANVLTILPTKAHYCITTKTVTSQTSEKNRGLCAFHPREMQQSECKCCWSASTILHISQPEACRFQPEACRNHPDVSQLYRLWYDSLHMLGCGRQSGQGVERVD